MYITLSSELTCVAHSFLLVKIILKFFFVTTPFHQLQTFRPKYNAVIGAV